VVYSTVSRSDSGSDTGLPAVCTCAGYLHGAGHLHTATLRQLQSALVYPGHHWHLPGNQTIIYSSWEADYIINNLHN
jgi:hypothetical protein